jgi:hypothetical protein
MSRKLVFELEASTGLGIEFDIGLFSNGQSAAIGGEGMVLDGAVEEVVDFGRSHCSDRSNSLLLLMAIKICWMLDVGDEEE